MKINYKTTVKFFLFRLSRIFFSSGRHIRIFKYRKKNNKRSENDLTKETLLTKSLYKYRLFILKCLSLTRDPLADCIYIKTLPYFLGEKTKKNAIAFYRFMTST